MRRRALVTSLVLMTGCALTLTPLAPGRIRGFGRSPPMSVWVSGTNLGQDIGTLQADNARVPKDVANGTGAVHAACGTLLDDAEMANSKSALTRSRRHRAAHAGLRALSVIAANQCYDAGATNT